MQYKSHVRSLYAINYIFDDKLKTVDTHKLNMRDK